MYEMMMSLKNIWNRGLLALQNMLKDSRFLSHLEVFETTEIQSHS